MLQEVERLSALGLNEAQISESIGMGYRTFQTKKHHFSEALKKGKAELRARVSEALLSKIDEGDTTALIFTAKRLNLFTPSIEAKTPATIHEALKELTSVYSAVARGELSEATGDKLAGYLERFMRAIELSEFEDRLLKLEGKTK
jgi:ASC-1-like (ASCH) protein